MLKVQELFLKRFDNTTSKLGYSRTEAIREAMRRFEQEGEKRLMERPEMILENMSKLYGEQQKQVFENIKKIQESRQKPVIWMKPNTEEDANTASKKLQQK